MDTQRWEQIQTLFLAVLERDPDEQATFLDEACAGDSELRRVVEGMLASHEQSQALAIENRLLAGELVEATDPEDLLDTRIGPYRLKRLIGRGGMGDVYLAERDDEQYRQEVALKLVRPGFHTAEIVTRFRTERQILARLVHPNIAQLLDGGMTDDGRPYLVMQYIEGVSITQYCDAHRLSVEERLRLFRTVCPAVQVAHRNLVVHRDLKPSNILVTEEGQVKLLDFGIAKLLDPEAVGVSVAQTRSEVRVMTPEYAAPEQVRGEAVTTATDVYALGVLLYELLTGHRPYRVSGRLQAEIERIICEEEPTRPSTAISTVEEVQKRDGTTETLTPQRVSAARRAPVGRLQRLLRGDLDNMVMMALRKEPERRYASVEQLAEDVGRYLGGRPVMAQKDTVGYRVRKFVRRHRIGVGMASAFVLLLIGFSVVTAWQAQTVARERDAAQAERDAAQVERDKSEQVVQVLVDLFETSNPTVVPGGDALRVGEFLEQGEARVLEDLEDQPEVQARMKQVLGNIYRTRSQYDRARPLLEEALAQQRALKGPDDPDAAAMFHDLAQLTQETGDLKTAEALFRESLALHRKIYGDVHETVAQSMQDLAGVIQDDAEERRLLHEALAMRRALLPEVHMGIADNLNQLTIYHYQNGQLEEASGFFRESLDIVKQLRGEEHPHTLTVMGNLAALYAGLGKLDEAEAIHRQMLPLKRKIYGPETAAVANSLSFIGGVLVRKGDHRGAEEAYRDAYALRLKIHGRDHRQTANDARNLGRILQLQKRYEEAFSYLQEAIAIGQQVSEPESPVVAYMTGQLGMLLLDMGRVDEALRNVQESVRIIQEKAPDRGHYVADGQVWLGQVLLVTDAPREAEPLLREALAYRQSTLPADHPKIAEARCILGVALSAQGLHGEAEPLLREAYPIYNAWGLADANAVEQTRRRLVETYTALGQPDKAAAYQASPTR